jgi:hypothetical protein
MLMYLQMQNFGPHFSSDSAIDQGPYVNVADGMVSAMCNEQNGDDMVEELPELHNVSSAIHDEKDNKIVSDVQQDGHLTGAKDDASPDIAETSNSKNAEHHGGISPVRRCLHLLSRQNSLLYVAACLHCHYDKLAIGRLSSSNFLKKEAQKCLTCCFPQNTVK